MFTVSKSAFVWLVAAIEEFRKINPEMQAQTMLTFCTVAMREGDRNPLSMKEVERLTGMSSSSASRNVASLGPTHKGGKPGMDLVVAFDNPLDRREKLLKLTPRGRRVAESISRYVKATKGE